MDNKIEQLEQEQKRDTIENWDCFVFPKSGEQLAEGNKVRLGVLKEEEKEQYLAVKYEYSPLKRAYKDEEFREEVWKDFISESAFVCSIYEKDSNEFVGYCSIKDLSEKDWELAIELKSDKCHKGYGTEALSLFMENVHNLTGRRFFRVRVEIGNHASQGLMKKLGAYSNGISEFWLHGDEIERFQEEYKYMITDEIRNNLLGCELVMLESNHDIGMLQNGPYPYALKRRILSEVGHLSNIACADMTAELVSKGTSRLYLGHISQDNNFPGLAYQTNLSAITEKTGAVVGKDYLMEVNKVENDMGIIRF